MVRLLLTLLLGFAFAATGAENLLCGDGKAPVFAAAEGSSIKQESTGEVISFTLTGRGEAVAEVAGIKEGEWLQFTCDPTDRDGKARPEISFSFLNDAGRETGRFLEFRPALWNPGEQCCRIFEVPWGGKKMKIVCRNLGSGRIAFRNLRLEEIKKQEWDNAPLPGQAELWDVSDAERLRTATRDRLCLNGLWQFQPVKEPDGRVPAPSEYGYYFKVPGIWPGFDGWGQPGSDQRIVRPDGSDSGLKAADIEYAWYRRTFAVPKEWKGRKLILELSFVQSRARVFVDGREAGEIVFPGGELDVTRFLRPGETQELAVRISAAAENMKDIRYSDKDRVHVSKLVLKFRGINGDAYLRAEPAGPRITDLLVIPSVSKGTIGFEAGFTDAVPDGSRLETVIYDGGKEVKRFRSEKFSAGDGSRFRYTSDWKNPKLWDVDAPENLYIAKAFLYGPDGRLLDEFYPQEFGFREFGIDGRDLTLNGKVIHLRSTPSLTPQAGAGVNTPVHFERTAGLMRAFGLNFFFPLNYNYQPGLVNYLDSYVIENSRNGILTSVTLPHPCIYFDLDKEEGVRQYTALAGYLIRRYQNVPGLAFYASTHNSLWFFGSDQPEKLGRSSTKGLQSYSPQMIPRVKKAEKIIATLDPTRKVYHHSAGLFGDFMTINCYLNWMPAQERRDYLELWGKHGTKPLMFVEYGLPHLPTWSSFRGPEFIWAGSHVMSMWVNEYLAPEFGDDAFLIDGIQRGVLERQVQAFGNKKVPFSNYSWFSNSPAVQRFIAGQIRETFREMRAHGLSGFSPWDHYMFWQNPGRTVPPRLVPDRYRNLKRTGVSPDWFQPCQRDFNFGGLTPQGIAARDCYRPLLGWIAGRSGEFTEQSHVFRPGETVRKSLVLLNDTRREANVRVRWQVPALKLERRQSVTVAVGGRSDIPVEFRIPDGFQDKELAVDAEFEYPDGRVDRDRLELQVLPERSFRPRSEVVLFDPEHSAETLLRRLGIPFRTYKTGEKLPANAILLIGRDGLDRFPGDFGGIASAGTRILLLEQSHNVLWNRLGIRSTEYGLRRLFALDPEFRGEPLDNWRGSSTNAAPFQARSEWCELPIQGNIRAGNRGTVTGVIPEKPCVGDWMPLLHGGFNLSYSPLLEFREGKAIVLFCQLDVSGRSEESPEALELFRAALEHLDRAEPRPTRRTFYLGDERGAAVLDLLKIRYSKQLPAEKLGEGDLLILGPGAGSGPRRDEIENGLNILALGLGREELETLLPGEVKVADWKPGFSYPSRGLDEEPLFRGISNAELFYRKPLSGPFFNDGKSMSLRRISHGRGNVVCCQLAPWMFEADEYQLRITRRRCHALVSRLIHNLGGGSESGLLNAFAHPRRMLITEWEGKADREQVGRDRKFFLPTDRSTGWKPVQVPGKFDTEANGLEGYDGDFWYRTRFDLPQLPESGEVTLELGAIDDFSWVWLNGEFLGEVTDKTHPDNYWNEPRSYRVDVSKLRKQGNCLVVLCRDLRGSGGIFHTPSIRLQEQSGYNLYSDNPEVNDEPYRYFHW